MSSLAAAHVHERNSLQVFYTGTAAIGLLCGAIFLAIPDIDLIAGRAFYMAGDGFAGNHQGWIGALRVVFICFYWACVIMAIAGLIATRGGRHRWLRLGPPQWLFLAICLAAGPGLVANAILKDQWGRARPKHVVEFGGVRTFTPALLPTDQCARNCSFVSGEASSVFAPFYAAAVVLPQWSAALIAAGTLGGLAVGVVRMIQGAHFLSDVVFAGVFMALTVCIVQRLMFGPPWLTNLIAQRLRPRPDPA